MKEVRSGADWHSGKLAFHWPHSVTPRKQEVQGLMARKIVYFGGLFFILLKSPPGDGVIINSLACQRGKRRSGPLYLK